MKRKRAISLPLVVLILTMISVPGALSENFRCYIRSPGGVDVASDTYSWTECIGAGCNENHGGSCSASCPPSNSACCQEEGLYSWYVDSSVDDDQAGTAYTVSWDGDEAWCDCYLGSGSWSLGGEVAASSCCGDDSGEAARTRSCNSGCTSSSSDDACCDSGTDCVYSDTCYSNTQCRGTDLYCTNGAWSDSDDNQVYCDACVGPGNWITGGGCCGDDSGESWCGSNSTHCSSGSTITDADNNQWACDNCEGSWEGEGGQQNCCGDDTGELGLTCQDNGEGYCAMSVDDTGCCDDADDCVFEGVCYNNGYATGSWICNAGDWHDQVSPSTTDNAVSTWSGSDQTVTLACDDGADGSGCAEVDYCTGTASCSPGGNYDISSGTRDVSVTCLSGSVCRQYVRYRSEDAAGNVESPVRTSAETRIDKEDPVTTPVLNGPQLNPPWYSGSVTVNLDDCNDGAGSGCSSTEYCTGSGCTPDQAYSGPVTVSSEGTTYFRFRSDDMVGNVETTQEAIIQIDTQDPTAQIDPLPAFVNATNGFNIQWDVDWQGSDSGSGIAFFDIQYRRTDRLTGTVEVDWADWLLGQASNPGSATFDAGNTGTPQRNNRTFDFRIRATDNAGNTIAYNGAPYENVIVDIQAPQCAVTIGMDAPPNFDGDGFLDLTFDSVEGESGMARFHGEFRGPGTGGSWEDIEGASTVCTPTSPMANSDSVTLSCTLNTGYWEFRCSGTDQIGNRGSWSPIEDVTVDLTPPSVSFILPNYQYTDQDSIPVQWQSPDPDVDHFELYYYETAWPGGPPSDGQWVLESTYPPATTSMDFGPSTGHTLTHGQTYYLNISAVDTAGHWVSAEEFVTVDQEFPTFEIETRDQFGNPIPSEFIPSSSAITIVNISSTAYDSLSGIISNRIEYSVFGTSPDSNTTDCGPGPSPGSSHCATFDVASGRHDIAYDESTSIRYRIITEDRAGNVNISRYYFTVSHPLANFGEASVFLALGETKLLPVLVRNVQNEQDDVQVNLSGTNTFARFEFNCTTECKVSPDKRSIYVSDVNPYEERIYYVRLYSMDPGTYTLDLDARSMVVDLSLTDSHNMTMRTSYPIYFPGIGPWGILLLVLLAGLSFGLLSRFDI